MKKVLSVLFPVLLAFALISCSAPGGASPDAEEAKLLDSYYAGQESQAFGMLQKSIFQRLIGGWTDESIQNPSWNYDSFARYDILNEDFTSSAGGQELYYCTFSASGGKSGYIVLSYDGDSLSRVSAAETPYLYDLRSSLDEIAPQLEQAEIELSSAEALRVRIAAADGGQPEEAIRVTDQAGHTFLYYFSEV